MRQYLMKTIQDDAQRAGERDCLLLEARRAHVARRRRRAGPAVLVRRLAQLLFRRATVQDSRPGAGQPHGPEAPRGFRVHRTLVRHEVVVDDGAAAEQTLPPLAPNRTM
jgi:hypothetical protein